MTPHYTDHSVTLYHGDCLDVLRQFPDNSVDAVVTDPPYGLEFMGKDWDKFDRKGPASFENLGSQSFIREDGFVRESSPYSDKPRHSTMGPKAMRAFQQWCELWAAECLRVLKPGGHMLAFGGTRTFHRLACAVEDAGFEIRDSIAWLYGSGFPKSLDVSKAIDRARNDDPAWRVVGQWLRVRREAAGYRTRADLAPLILDGHKNLESAAANLSNWENGLSFPTWDRWLSLKTLLGLSDDMDTEVWRLNGRKGSPGEAWDQREVIGERTTGIGTGRGAVAYIADSDNRDVTAPATDAARQWQGWGTALKPAFEPVVVARKPLAGTVAGNVQAWGTGALNVDGCRIGDGEDRSSGGAQGSAPQPMSWGEPTGRARPTGGRWPANVVLDETQAAALDQQSGDIAGQVGMSKTVGGHRFIEGDTETVQKFDHGVKDHGGASRFFYTAKADAKERIRLPKAGAGEGRVTGLGGKIRECNICGSKAINSGANELTCGHNDHRWVDNPRPEVVAHPTVKPLSLMRWLVRLVTPPGGTVLEPFAGSGTTVEACILEGLHCIAIEREADYLPLIVQRVNRQRDPIAYTTTAGEDLGLFGLEELA